MREESLGPVFNPDGTPTEVTKQMLAGTGRSPEELRPGARDVAFIKEGGEWPAWPFLPLKRGEQLGYILDGPAWPRPVFAGNIWAASEGDPVIKEYGSAEAIVADGWRVD